MTKRCEREMDAVMRCLRCDEDRAAIRALVVTYGDACYKRGREHRSEEIRRVRKLLCGCLTRVDFALTERKQ